MWIDGRFTAQVTTNDSSPVVVFSFIPDPGVTRVEAAGVVACTSKNASYGRIGSFVSIAGVVSSIGAVASLGIAEQDSTFDMALDTDGLVIRLTVTGAAATAARWRIVGSRLTIA